MKILHFVSAYFLLVGLFSCSKAEKIQNEKFYVNNDRADLNKRVTLKHEKIELTTFKTIDPVNLNLIATVTPPDIKGVRTVATHVQVDGNYAYISYHTVGEQYGGGIDIIDITDPNNPAIYSAIYYFDADFYGLLYENDAIYAVGSADPDVTGFTILNTKGAFAQRHNLVNGAFNGAPVGEMPLASYAATSVGKSGRSIFVTTGDEGGWFYLLDSIDVGLIELVEEENAKSVGRYGGVILRGSYSGESPAALVYYHHNMLSVAPRTVVPLPGNVTDQGKNSIAWYPGHVVAALGEDGIVKVENSSGTVLDTYVEVGEEEAVASTEIGLNTYVAYGDNGLVILDADYDKIAQYDMGTWGHANYVATNGTLIFVASGPEGLQILSTAPTP